MIAGAGSSAVAESPPPSATPRPPEQIYKAVCGYCHGANVGPILLGRQLNPVLVKTISRHGLNAMPAFRPTEVSDPELNALASWIEQSKADPGEHGQ